LFCGLPCFFKNESLQVDRFGRFLAACLCDYIVMQACNARNIFLKKTLPRSIPWSRQKIRQKLAGELDRL
jgi:hypothetical protein